MSPREPREIRQSQTVSPFGVGGIFDIQGESFVACDTTLWQRPTDIRSRLAAALRVQTLKAAPALEVGPDGRARPSAGVPYARFPGWLFCQECRRMRRWRPSDETGNEPPRCSACTSESALVPMRWVQVCEAGHLGDVDWRFWAHFGQTAPDRRQCKVATRLRFTTISGRGSAALDGLVIRCDACDASRSLSGITKANALSTMGVGCEGRQPWQSFDKAVTCVEPPRAVQRGASNVYFPLTTSSIEIPSVTDEEGPVNPLVAEIMDSDLFRAVCAIEPGNHMFQGLINMIADAVKAPEDLVLAVVNAERGGGPGEGAEAGAARDLLAEEWTAFTAADSTRSSDFITRRVALLSPNQMAREDMQLLAAAVNRVVIVDRLREVRALLGFNRVKPAAGEKFVRPSLTPQPRWLPATEVYGEGVLLGLDEEALATWEVRDDVRSRTAHLERRLQQHFMADRLLMRTGPRLLPRYVLLHTLGHLLIRRLAYESGYSASSIRERVYGHSGPEPDQRRPSGLLIYTAAGDAEGTLGGLARQGEPGRLSETLVHLLADATWCSADPLCGENRGSGFGALNNAACHACSLVPETSCEASNLLLDRALLVGDAEVAGFLQPVIEQTRRLAIDQASASPL